MKRLLIALSAALIPAVCVPSLSAQMAHEGMKHEAGVPSKTLVLTGLDGATKTLSADDLKAMTHVTVTVMNGHSHQQETYSGVPLKDLLALVSSKPIASKPGAGPRVSPRTTVVLAGATDHFQVALTLCDTDPGCRSGQAIVADTLDSKPLAADGAFKLILTEDKMPGRWVRNLDSLTEKNVGAM
jgi:hypothetical protein